MSRHVTKNKANTDFTKLKRKVGKKAPEVASTTNTTIISKTIDVPLQALEEKTEPVTSRNLTLNDLLQQVVHYNPSVRREAYQGLAELFGKYPDIFERNISHLIVRFGEGMIDSDPQVRRSVCALMFQHLYIIPPAKMNPFMSMYMQYIAAAISHIDSGIRADSVHFLRLLNTLYPALIRQHCTPLLPNFTQILNDRHLVIHHSNQSSSTSMSSTAPSLPSVSINMNKLQRESNSGKRHHVRNLGASGLFASNANSVHSNNQGMSNDGITGIGSLLMTGMSSVQQNTTHTIQSVLDQFEEYQSRSMCSVFKMDSNATEALHALNDTNAVNKQLLTMNVATMTPLQISLCVLDSMLKLHAPPADVERLNDILHSFQSALPYNTDTSLFRVSTQDTQHQHADEKNKKDGIVFTGSNLSASSKSHHNNINVASSIVNMNNIIADPLSALLQLNHNITNQTSETSSTNTQSESYRILEKISSLSTDLIPVLFDCWVESFPPEWSDRERDDYEHLDMETSLAKHLKLHGHSDTALKKQKQTDKSGNKKNNKVETNAKVLSHSLAVMGLITSCVLSLARVDIAVQKAQGLEAHMMTPPLAAFAKKLNTHLYPFFPLRASAVHDIKSVADINLNIAYLITLLISTTPATVSPQSYYHDLMTQQRSEQEQEQRLAQYAPKNTVSEAELKKQQDAEKAKEAELELMRMMGYSKKKTDKNKQQQKKAAEMKEERHRQHVAAAKSRQLNEVNQRKYDAYTAKFNDTRDLEQALVEYIHMSFVHHTEQETKAQDKLQMRIQKRVFMASTARAATTTEAANGEVSRKRKRGDTQSDSNQEQDQEQDDEVPPTQTKAESKSDDLEVMIAANNTTLSTQDTSYPSIAPLADLLHIVWAFLPHAPPHLQTWLVETFSNFYASASIAPLSANKVMCVPLLCALLHLQGGGRQWAKFGFINQLWLPSLPPLLSSILAAVNINGIPHNDILRSNLLHPQYSSFTFSTLQDIPLAVAAVYVTNSLSYAARVYNLVNTPLIAHNNMINETGHLDQVSTSLNAVETHTQHVLHERRITETDYSVKYTNIDQLNNTTDHTFDWDCLQADWVQLIGVPTEVTLVNDTKVTAFKPGNLFSSSSCETTQQELIRCIGYSAYLSSSLLYSLATACRYSGTFVAKRAVANNVLTAVAMSDDEANNSKDNLFNVPDCLPLSVRLMIVNLIAEAGNHTSPDHLAQFFLTACMASTDASISPIVPPATLVEDSQIHYNTQLGHPAITQAVLDALDNISLDLCYLQRTRQDDSTVYLNSVPELTAVQRGEILLDMFTAPLVDLINTNTQALLDADQHVDIDTDIAVVNIARLCTIYTHIRQHVHESVYPTSPSLSKALSRALAYWLPMILSQSKEVELNKVTYVAQPNAMFAVTYILQHVGGVFSQMVGYWLYNIHASLYIHYANTHAFVKKQSTPTFHTSLNLSKLISSRSLIRTLNTLSSSVVVKSAFYNGNVDETEKDTPLYIASTTACPLPSTAKHIGTDIVLGTVPADLTPVRVLMYIYNALYAYVNHISTVKPEYQQTLTSAPESISIDLRQAIADCSTPDELEVLRSAIIAFSNLDPMQEE